MESYRLYLKPELMHILISNIALKISNSIYQVEKDKHKVTFLVLQALTDRIRKTISDHETEEIVIFLFS